MINRISLTNFKAHANTAIGVRALTLFIGPNNSGKSSLGQALVLLKQAMAGSGSSLCRYFQRKPTSFTDPYLYPEDSIIDLGDFPNVVRRGQHEITIGIEGDYLGIVESPYGPFHVSLDVRFSEQSPGQERLNFHKGKIQYGALTNESGGGLTWQWAEGQQVVPVTVKVGEIRLVFQPGGSFPLLSGSIQYSGPVEQSKLNEAQTLFNLLINAPRSLVNSVHPIFPLRGLEERGSPLTEAPARNLERISVADRTVALLSMLAYDLDLQERISDWLENLIERRIKVPLLPGKRVTLLSVPPRSRGAESLFSNEGTGANQLPFILVPIGITPPNETIFLTEPEAHLHPELQTKLTSLLIRLIKEEGRQFVVETHSEHVLHSVLSAVAKSEISTSELAIYDFENKNGIATCRKLEVSDKGQVEGGLPGFFEQSISELSEYLDALKKN
jgi:energy-coupling factor transporter ATP-binding protein EcfA2